MSDCNVCLSYDVQDAEFFARKELKARIAHKCSECDEGIAKGSQYVRVGGIQAGEWWRQRLCIACDDIGTVFSCGGDIVYGNLWEDMEENVFDGLTMTSPCLRKLKPESLAYLMNRWWKWKTA